MSIKLEELQMILNQSVKDSATRTAILEEARKLEDEKAADKEDGIPKIKNKFTILLRCDDPELKKNLENQEAFLVKTPESLDEDTIIERIAISAARQNQSVKKAKGKISTYAEWQQRIKGKFRSTEDTNVQNVGKSPVRILVLDKAEIDFSK